MSRYPAAIAPVDVDAVLAANKAFYDAFEARDLDAMSDVWEHSDRVVCTHPGWGSLRGWGSVSASFLALFSGAQHLQFILTEVHAHVEDGTAWVTVDENILSDDVGGTVASVNVFTRTTNDRWRMVVHHGSPVATSTSD